MIKKVWRFLWSPSGAISVGVLLLFGFVGGILFWGGLHWSVEASNSEAFCISCHEMRDNVYEEYKKTAHYSSASGVGAVCSDCHVPRAWLPKMIRKVRATNELYHHFMGSVDTPEKFNAKRAELAKRVWAEMEANDSLECRNCHKVDRFDYSKMDPKAAEAMRVGLANGDTCIDCHKGIAHSLPDLSSGYKALHEALVLAAQKSKKFSDRVYPVKTISFYRDAKAARAGGKPDGQFLAATELKVLDDARGALRVRASGWQQDGVGRIVYARMGHRIFEATLKPAMTDAIKVASTETDPGTDLVWHKVSFEAWIAPGHVVGDVEEIWDYSREMYTAACATCHSKPDPGHHLANQWIGIMKAMQRFVSLDKEETRVLQKYLQLNAKDTGGAH